MDKIRLGVSKKIKVVEYKSHLLKYFNLESFWLGKNPQNVNLSVGNPDTVRAVSTAEGPGEAVTKTSILVASLTSR